MCSKRDSVSVVYNYRRLLFVYRRITLRRGFCRMSKLFFCRRADLWMAYIDFERRQDVLRVGQLHWRATKALNEDLLQEFSRRFTLAQYSGGAGDKITQSKTSSPPSKSHDVQPLTKAAKRRKLSKAKAEK